jgi:hypothetical protein
MPGQFITWPVVFPHGLTFPGKIKAKPFFGGNKLQVKLKRIV